MRRRTSVELPLLDPEHRHRFRIIARTFERELGLMDDLAGEPALRSLGRLR